MDNKRSRGQYFTCRNIFSHPAFLQWAEDINLKNQCILEPFAGENSLISMLQELALCTEYQSFDISPRSPQVQKKDTLASFPQGFRVIVTNPPYLAKNSAARRGIPLPDASFDDLYKYALKLCLDNTPHTAAIIPASFLNSGLFRSRLHCFIALPYKDMFADTDHPVCLALFGPESRPVSLYEGEQYLGTLPQLEACLPKGRGKGHIVFNHPQGNLGLRAVDNTTEASIAFLPGDFLHPSRVKHSSRNLSRLWVEGPVDLDALNKRLQQFREESHDIFLTPFKGLRKDGRFRRRLDFALARQLILSVLEE